MRALRQRHRCWRLHLRHTFPFVSIRRLEVAPTATDPRPAPIPRSRGARQRHDGVVQFEEYGVGQSAYILKAFLGANALARSHVPLP